jgi:hypothetical protein
MIYGIRDFCVLFSFAEDVAGDEPDYWLLHGTPCKSGLP